MIELLNIDCMELMARYPDKHFDLAICDPPYMDETLGLNGGVQRKKFNYSAFQKPTEIYFTELQRVSKNQIIWGGNYFTDMLPLVGAGMCGIKFKAEISVVLN